MRDWTGKFIGIVPAQAVANRGYTKRLLLMFDGLALSLGTREETGLSKDVLQAMNADLSWLSNEGMLSTLDAAAINRNRMDAYERVLQDWEMLSSDEQRKLKVRQRVSSFREAAVERKGDREAAAEMRSQGIDAICVPSGELPSLDSAGTKATVARITIFNLPTPSEITPWEAIRDFRSDKSSMSSWARLKSWMNSISQQNLTNSEILDTLRDGIRTYEDALILHRIETRQKKMEVVVATGPKLLENLMKLKLGNAASDLLAYRGEQISALHEELALPGRQFSYLIASQDSFRA